MQITVNGVDFPGGTHFSEWRLTDTLSGSLTTPEDETITMHVEGDKLIVWFGYDHPATVIYEGMESDTSLGKSECSLIGIWNAVEWTQCGPGGDPDPVNDERVVQITESGVDFSYGTYFSEWILTDVNDGRLMTYDDEIITLHVEGERLTIWFGYERPATIIYQRQ